MGRPREMVVVLTEKEVEFLKNLLRREEVSSTSKDRHFNASVAHQLNNAQYAHG